MWKVTTKSQVKRSTILEKDISAIHGRVDTG